MKKFIRTAVLVFALTVLCFSLSGCHALNEARNAQAFKNDDGTILYNGKIYKALPDREEFADLSYSLTYDHGNMVYVTDKDVPVLLSAFFGQPAFTDKDKKIIFTDYLTDSTSNSLKFCREDIYDTLVEEIKNPNFTKYTMALDSMGLSYLLDDIDIPDSVDLKDYEIAAINEIIALNDTVENPDTFDSYDGVYAEIFRSTDDGFIYENYCTLLNQGDSYYISVYGPETFDEDGYFNQSVTIYKVPTSGEAAAKIKNLLEKKKQIDDKIAELIGNSDILDDLYDPNSFGFSE